MTECGCSLRSNILETWCASGCRVGVRELIILKEKGIGIPGGAATIITVRTRLIEKMTLKFGK